jgi:hypothetical protein
LWFITSGSPQRAGSEDLFLIMDIKSGLYIQRCTQPKVTKGEKKQKREKPQS